MRLQAVAKARIRTASQKPTPSASSNIAHLQALEVDGVSVVEL